MFKNVMTYLGLGPDEEYDDGYLYEDEPDDEPNDRDRRHVTSVSTTRSQARHSDADSMSNGGADDLGHSASAVSSVRPLRPVPSPEYDDDWSGPSDEPRRSFNERHDAVPSRVRATPVGSGQRSDTLDLDAEEARSLSARTGGSNERSLGGDRQRSEPVVRPVPIQRTKPRALTPKTFGDAKLLADDIKNSVPVVMNLREADRDLGRRLIDFASGVCYSLDASMEKLASQVFLLTPASVEVSGEERRRIEERGFDR